MPPSSDYTANAIRSMFGPAADENTSLIVHMRLLSSNNPQTIAEVIIYDGSDQTRAVLLNEDLTYSDLVPCVVEIKGYVVSKANHGNVKPIICIVDFDVVKPDVNPSNKLLLDKRLYKSAQGRNPGGTISTFLSQWVPFLDNKYLSGNCDECFFSASIRDDVWNCEFDEKYNAVSDFLSHHLAMKTLHESSASSVTSNKTATDAYMSALREFEVSQMERQNASLANNSSKETAAGALQVSLQYKATLEKALEFCDKKEVLTVKELCDWHRLLCGNGLASDENHPGSLRHKNVRTGNTHYCHYDQVPADLQELCDSLIGLEARLLHGSDSNFCSNRKVEHALVFSSAVLMGIADIHPFCDGNGRLSRIGLNWALRKVGFPFVIHLFATPVQRTELIRAFQLTRRNINLVKRGNVPDEVLLQAYQIAGAFSPLVELILDRLHKAVIEFHKIIQEKVSLHSEQEEDRAARKYRERAASGVCMICFDEKPNVATLCCGKAVHLNCMAEWLSSSNSCPQCRAEMPPLPERMTRSQREDEEEETETSVDSQSNGSTIDLPGLLNAVAAGIQNSAHENNSTNISMDDNSSTTSFDEEIDDGNTSIVPSTNAVAPNDNAAADDDAGGTTDTMVDASTSMDDDDGGIGSTACASTAPDPRPICFRSNCYNIAAKDCQNMACGRCCLLHGQFNCARHNC